MQCDQMKATVLGRKRDKDRIRMRKIRDLGEMIRKVVCTGQLAGR